MRTRLLLVLGLLIAAGLISATAWAQEGVGVNVGKIQVDEPLAPGGTYRIPAVGVINTGHESSGYRVRITYLSGQQELQPPEDWFSFGPETFTLEPGTTENVSITLKLPLTARPGDYFAFVEASPVSNDARGGVAVGIAAATRLNFTVEASNVFSASFLWVFHHFRDWTPWSWIVTTIFAAAIASFVLIKVFKVRIRMERG